MKQKLLNACLLLIFFLLKETQRRLWKAKPSSIGGSMLANKNYGNLRNQAKYIDTLKYYQKSFAEMTTSMNEEEKTCSQESNRTGFT